MQEIFVNVSIKKLFNQKMSIFEVTSLPYIQVFR